MHVYVLEKTARINSMTMASMMDILKWRAEHKQLQSRTNAHSHKNMLLNLFLQSKLLQKHSEKALCTQHEWILISTDGRSYYNPRGGEGWTRPFLAAPRFTAGSRRRQIQWNSDWFPVSTFMKFLQIPISFIFKWGWGNSPDVCQGPLGPAQLPILTPGTGHRPGSDVSDKLPIGCSADTDREMQVAMNWSDELHRLRVHSYAWWYSAAPVCHMSRLHMLASVSQL